MTIPVGDERTAQLLEKLARQVPGMLYQYRRFPDGRAWFPFASEGIRSVFEIEPADVQVDTTRLDSRIHPDDRDRVFSSIEESARTLGSWRCTFRVCLPNAGERWLQGDANPERLDDGSVLWHGHITDVTDAERARERLRESELRYRIIVDYAPEAITLYDVERSRFVDINQNAEALFRLTRAEFLAHTPASLSPPLQPDGRASSVAAMEWMKHALAGEAPVFEWIHRAGDGVDFPSEVRLVSLPYEGRVLVRASITDIRERKRIESAMRQLEAAIGSSISAIAIADLAGDITYVNRAFLRLWGYENESEALGRPAVSFWESPALATEVRQALFATGAWVGEITARPVDGVRRTLTLQANLFRNAAGEPQGLLALFVDVTDARELQHKLDQAQRLESVGRLAGGVAHDFNNLLTVMKGNIELLEFDVPVGTNADRSLHEIGHAVDSAARLTQQLLAFSRKQTIAPRSLDLNQVVQCTLGMLGRLLGEDIELRFTPGADLWPVQFDPGQAEQILINLAVNARDAMRTGGRLSIETANVAVTNDAATGDHEAAGSRFVRLTVSDTGEGMSADTREHAFEPFFTTKAPAEGTGLGLSMIHGAVLQNGGQIRLFSAPGERTRVEIDLPPADRVHETPTSVPVLPVHGGHERILLVEDDAPLRRLGERLLRQLGYDVQSASSGVDALEMLANGSEEYQLLLTDVIMPNMNGKVLAEKAVAMCPGLRVMFMSGYTADVIAKHGALAPDVHFLAKPFTLQSLSTSIRQVFDAPV